MSETERSSSPSGPCGPLSQRSSAHRCYHLRRANHQGARMRRRVHLEGHVPARAQRSKELAQNVCRYVMGTVRVQREDNSRLSAVVVIGFQLLSRPARNNPPSCTGNALQPSERPLYGLPGPSSEGGRRKRQAVRPRSLRAPLWGSRGSSPSPGMGFAAFAVDAAVAAILQALQRQPHPQAAELPTQTGVCSTTSRETVGSRALRQQQNW
jgi:hypothetical protein